MASIQKRGKNSYLLVVEAGYDANGKRIRRTKTVHCKNKREAEIELAKFVAEVESGEYIKPEKMYFSDFIDEWKERYAKHNLAPLTLKTYMHHIQNHILPVFGHKRLDEIQPFHIVTFLDELSKPGARKDGRGETLSNATLEYIHRVLKNIFSRAVEWKLLKTHPMEKISKPNVTAPEAQFYDKDEAQEVIEKLYEEPIMWRLLIMGALLGGFRRGELLALEWTDVDFENLTISVKKSISLTVNGEAIVKEPKTKKSKRIVAMPSWYMQELKKYYHQWKVEKLKVGELWQGGDHQYIFHSGFGKPLYHTSPTAWWRKFVKRHGLKYIRFHDLRHSAAAILIQNEVPIKAIQERLGHSRHQTTADIYAHVAKSVSRAVAEKLEDLKPKSNSSTIRQQV